jgi:hypothetical protein
VIAFFEMGVGLKGKLCSQTLLNWIASSIWLSTPLSGFRSYSFWSWRFTGLSRRN